MYAHIEVYVYTYIQQITAQRKKVSHVPHVKEWCLSGGRDKKQTYMYICVCVYLYMYICIDICIYIHIYIQIDIDICIYTNMHR